MKKILILMLTAIAIASCNDDCDHGFIDGQINSDILVGSWYEEATNEEDIYSPSSHFYGKYCNQFQQGEGQGTYILDPERNRMKWSYQINGMHRTTDWKLRDVTKYQFIQYSDIGICTYGKIVETYEMNGGETQKIAFNELDVQGYESINENIATVSSDGIITATGEKGTAYIKIKTAEANVYAKVIVGANVPDLWIDYSSLLGRDYDGMKELLGPPSINSKENINGEEVDNYSYNTPIHNILKGVSVAISSTTHKVVQIALNIYDGVPQNIIMSYLKNHYYMLESNYEENFYYYTTSNSLENSRAVYVYDGEKKLVGIFTKDGIGINLGNYEKGLGMSETELVDTFGEYNNNTGNQIIYNPNNSSINQVAFSLDSLGHVDLINIQLSSSVQSDAVMDYFQKHYDYFGGTNDFMGPFLQWLSKDSFESNTLLIGYRPNFGVITYSHLDNSNWGKFIVLNSYAKGVGMTKQQVVETFGYPFTETTEEDGERDALVYVPKGDIVEMVAIYIVKGTGIVNQIVIQLVEENDVFDDGLIEKFFDRRYYYSEKKQTQQGLLLRWINAEKLEDATLRASYYPDYNIVVYGSLE